MRKSRAFTTFQAQKPVVTSFKRYSYALGTYNNIRLRMPKFRVLKCNLYQDHFSESSH